MVYKVYYTLSQISFPFIRMWVRFRKSIGKECPIRYQERFGKTDKSFPDKAKKRIWIHAASIGETVAAIPLIKKLESRGMNVLLTTITRTSAQIAAERLPETLHQYVPYDHPMWLNRFLDHWQPSTLILIESEFWPNMLMQTAKRDIPIHLINARFSPRSFNRWRKFGVYFKGVFETINFATTPSKPNLELLSNLGIQFARYMPNLKFSAKPLPFDKEEKARLKEALTDRALWIGASIRKDEEEVFANLSQNVNVSGNKIPLSILIPRHDHVVEKLRLECKARNLRYILRSEGGVPQDEHDVWIIDTIGEMGLFFSLTSVVVMGGTFANCGGQNPIEPIMLGNAVIMGPSRHNFLDITELLAPSLTFVDSPDEALNQLQILMQDHAKCHELANKGKEICKMQAAILEELPEYIIESFQKKIQQQDKKPLEQKKSY